MPIDPAQFPGIAPDDAVVREIAKPNGDLVTIFASGAITMGQEGKPPRTRTREGRVFTSNAAGTPQEITPRRQQPPELKPLNVSSNATEEVGRLLSNFAERRFTFKGKPYRSVEGWYQGLKWPDEESRKKAAKLHGSEARGAGKGAPTFATFLFAGSEYVFGSAAHHALVKEAIAASLEQSPKVLQNFLATHPRPIIHETGRPERPGTFLPGVTFARILQEIREEHMPLKP